jgi:dephospho-CoA kinase
MFAELGATLIDTDVIAREVVEPGQPALEEIRTTFGDQVIGPDGHLDRKELRAIIFADDAKRRQLEAIIHPRIGAATIAQSEQASGPYQLIVVPLLTGSALRQYMDRVLVVDCDESTQLERLIARDAEDETQARRIISAQVSREERLAIADDVIKNDGNLEKTRRDVRQLHQLYLGLAAEKASAPGPL